MDAAFFLAAFFLAPFAGCSGVASTVEAAAGDACVELSALRSAVGGVGSSFLVGAFLAAAFFFAGAFLAAAFFDAAFLVAAFFFAGVFFAAAFFLEGVFLAAAFFFDAAFFLEVAFFLEAAFFLGAEAFLLVLRSPAPGVFPLESFFGRLVAATRFFYANPRAAGKYSEPTRGVPGAIIRAFGGA
ncbi:hypothetical protein G6O69_00505 [Pseudenhygromyxa sp. WMMC2535]|uniref:hypothetical protein n=1 Tax=Pseudenhygromyxa sp. WMMC2535 TaxID=2712867 RepID=UPI0015957E40|nr:hypothetical protein [Pseudenhygromyxa sp. WMMC2535]NVB36291.1 hypothetical protein [Pseudenhygromyxa sp. WMMC2535]